MNSVAHAKPMRLVTDLERPVFDALRDLPPGYTVDIQPDQIEIAPEWGQAFFYEPDCLVMAPDGRRLLVEVKSRYALTLMNMAILTTIQQHVQVDGAEFLVLVPDAQTKPSPGQLLAQFDQLHIAYLYGSSGVIPAVLDAFRDAAKDGSRKIAKPLQQ